MEPTNPVLEERSKIPRFRVALAKSCGIVPLKLLSLSTSCFKVCMVPKEDGIVPLNLFPSTIKSSSGESTKNPSGMIPSIVLEDKITFFKLVICPKDSDNGPRSSSFTTIKSSSKLRTETSSGIVPARPLPSIEPGRTF